MLSYSTLEMAKLHFKVYKEMYPRKYISKIKCISGEFSKELNTLEAAEAFFSEHNDIVVAKRNKDNDSLIDFESHSHIEDEIARDIEWEKEKEAEEHRQSWDSSNDIRKNYRFC